MKKQLTLPNIITLLRLVAIPYMAYLISKDENHIKAFLIFLLIWLTDMLDGYLARHLNQVSNVGKVLDPAVDKLFQLTTAITMCTVGKLPIWVPIFIAAKETLMIIGGAFLLRKKTVVYSRWYGKVATVLFALAFSALFFLPKSQVRMTNYLFILPVFFSALSLVKYGLHYFGPDRHTEEENERGKKIKTKEVA